MPETKYPADGSTRVYWIPGDEDAISDVSAPTVSELNAGVDLSCHIMSGGLAVGVSTATIDTASLCSAFISQANGRTSITPSLTMWRYTQPDDTAWELFDGGETGYLVIRSGLPTDDAWANGQGVIVAYVQVSEPAPEFPGGDTATTFNVNMLLVSGRLFDQKAWVGGVS
jgi:hypothetical protein